MIPGTVDRKVFLVPGEGEVELVRGGMGARLERPGAAPQKLSPEAAAQAEDRFRESGRLVRRALQARSQLAAALLLAHSRSHAASEELDWVLKHPRPARLKLRSRPGEDYYAAWCLPADWLRATATGVRGETPPRSDEERRPMQGLLLTRDGYRELVACALLLPDRQLDSFTAVWTY